MKKVEFSHDECVLLKSMIKMYSVHSKKKKYEYIKVIVLIILVCSWIAVFACYWIAYEALRLGQPISIDIIDLTTTIITSNIGVIAVYAIKAFFGKKEEENMAYKRERFLKEE